MNTFYTNLNTEALSPEESKHCFQVFRHKVGDNIRILNGKGLEVIGKLCEVSKQKCVFEILEKTMHPKPLFGLHVAVAPTKKMEKMEWLVEKITEILGYCTVTFIQTQNCERNTLRLDRLKKKMIGALKQSKNKYLPVINEEMRFNDFVEQATADQKWICCLRENATLLVHVLKKNTSQLILIGPEGDFTQEEIAYALKFNFKSVSLGNIILRTETAALVAAHTFCLKQVIK